MSIKKAKGKLRRGKPPVETGTPDPIVDGSTSAAGAKKRGRRAYSSFMGQSPAAKKEEKPKEEPKEKYDWIAAHKRTETMEDPAERDTELKKIVFAILEEDKDIHAAGSIALEIKDKLEQAICLLNVSEKLIEQGTENSIKAAKDRLGIALYDVKQIPNSGEALALYASIATSYAQLGDKQKAEQIFKEMLALVPNMEESEKISKEEITKSIKEKMLELGISKEVEPEDSETREGGEELLEYIDFEKERAEKGEQDEDTEEPDIMGPVEELIEEARKEKDVLVIAKKLKEAFEAAYKTEDAYKCAEELVRVADAFVELVEGKPNVPEELGGVMVSSIYNEALKKLDEVGEKALREEAKDELKAHMKKQGIEVERKKIELPPPPPRKRPEPPAPGEPVAQPSVVVEPDVDEDAETEVYEAATQVYELSEEEEKQVHEEARSIHEEIKETGQDPIRRLLIENTAMKNVIKLLNERLGEVEKIIDIGNLGTLVTQIVNEKAGDIIETKVANARIDELKVVHDLRIETGGLKELVEDSLLFEQARVTTQLVDGLLQDNYLDRVIKLDETYGTSALEAALKGVMATGVRSLRKQFKLDKKKANLVLERTMEVMNIYREGDE